MTENNDYSYLLDIINLVEGNEKPDSEKININFEGEFLNNNIGKFNTNFVNLISKSGDFNLSLSTKTLIDKDTDSSISELINKNLDKTDININHFDKTFFYIPKQGYWLSINNWIYGALPKTWIESINDYLDQVWVSSNYIKECYIDSGIKQDKLQVVNYGVDPLVFNPNVEKNNINVNKKIKFIYKGNLSWQSDFESILSAYTSEFCSDEDVCLIIVADENSDINQINKIQEVASKDDCPQIIIIQKDLKNEELAKIYAFSSFMISVKRIDDFCADAVNYMSCGKVLITSDYGSILDYCDKDNSIMVKSERVYQAKKSIENIETVDYPYWGEVNLNSLKVALRKAYEINDSEYNELCKKSSKSILEQFTYIKVGEKEKSLIKDIITQPIKRDVQENFNNILLEGLNYLTKGNYDKSEISLNKALEIYPQNDRANFYLANIMTTKGEYKKALEYNINSLITNPNQEDYNNLIGVILYKLGDYKLSESFFKRVIYLMPEHGGAKESLKAIETIKTSQFDNKDIVHDKRDILEKIANKNTSSDSYSLSVCILAKNEQANIERAIKSVKSIADEIIVLDTGSTDKTINIVKNHNVKLFNWEWQNDFSKARNEIMSYALGDWILMLDADEYLELENNHNIKPMLKNLSKEKVYQTKIINFIDKNNINEKIEHFVVRLIPNNQNIKYIRSIHEYPVKSNNSNIESEILNNLEIFHSGYLTLNVKVKDKIQRNRDILENALETDPESIIDYFYLAENYKEDNNYQKTIDYSLKVIEIENKYPQFDSIIKMAKMNLIESYIVQKDYDKALEYSDKFIEILDNRPDYWFLKGSIEFNRDNYDKSIEYEKKALTLKDVIVYPSIDTGAFSWKPLSIIAECYLKKDDYKNASLYYRRALKEYPENLSFYYKLTEIFSKLNDFYSLENILNSFIKTVSYDDTSHILENTYKIYLDNNQENKLYKLLESIRQEKITKQNLESDNLANTLIKIYTEILNKYPDMLAVSYSLACTYENIRQYEKARAIFENLSTEEPDALHNLASIAFSQNDLIKAEEIYKNVLEKDEFHIQSYLSLIKLQIKKEDLEKANLYITQLKELDPDNNDVYQLEFEVARASGDKKTASDMYAIMLFRNSLN